MPRLGSRLLQNGETIYAKIRRRAGLAKLSNPRLIEPATGVVKVMASPPTITAPTYADASAAATAGFSNVAQAFVKPVAFFSPTGGNPNAVGDFFGYLRLTSTTVNGSGSGGNVSGSLSNWVARYSVICDSAKVLIGVLDGTSASRFIVNGEYVSLTPTPVSSANPLVWFLLDFTSVGGRAIRHITLEMRGDGGFMGFYVGPTESISAVATEDRLMCGFIGDGMAAGLGGISFNADSLPYVAGDLLGVTDMRGAGIDKTGYWSTNAGASYSISQHVFDILNPNPDFVILEGGLYDYANGTSAAAWTAAQPGVASTIAQCRTHSPTLPIFVMGLPIASSTAALAWETNLGNYIASLDDPNLFWLPCISDPAGAWVTGTGSVATPSGSGTADIYYATSGFLPNTAGYLMLARRLAAAVLGAIAGKP